MRAVPFVVLALFSLALSVHGDDAPATPAVKHPETLEALVKEILAARAANEEARLKALVHAMVPKKSDVTAMVNPKAPGAEAFLASWKFADLPATAPEVAELAKALFDPRDPARTEVKATRATVEEIRAYAEGSRAYEEFPGGMRRFAALLADPAQTWWVVEQVKPGEDSGMKFTAFTRTADGRWLLFPKPWRNIPE